MNKLDKRKSPIAIEEEIEKTAKDIFNEFKQFDYTKIVLPKNCEFKKDALILLSF